MEISCLCPEYLPDLFFQKECPEHTGTTTMRTRTAGRRPHFNREAYKTCSQAPEEDCLLGGLGLGKGGHISELSRATQVLCFSRYEKTREH